MRWEHLTSPDFAKAVKETGVCIIALGVVERHSEHLPLGTDFMNGNMLANFAAEKEPAVVFPPFYFGQIYEARCFPGTLTLKPSLLVELLWAVLDEIGRNGFKKIILLNAHGGNNHLLCFMCQSTLWEQKPYSLYLYTGDPNPERRHKRQELLKTQLHAHACECETSDILANFPGVARMDQVPAESAEPLNRLEHLPANYSGIWWYASFPEHYAGDARPASAKTGLKMRELEVEALAEFIAAVKADKVVPALEKEFFEREASLRK